MSDLWVIAYVMVIKLIKLLWIGRVLKVFLLPLHPLCFYLNVDSHQQTIYDGFCWGWRRPAEASDLGCVWLPRTSSATPECWPRCSGPCEDWPCRVGPWTEDGWGWRRRSPGTSPSRLSNGRRRRDRRWDKLSKLRKPVLVDFLNYLFIIILNIQSFIINLFHLFKPV